MGVALDVTRPTFLPDKLKKWPGRGGPSWNDVSGPGISTNEDDTLILADELNTDIIPEYHD